MVFKKQGVIISEKEVDRIKKMLATANAMLRYINGAVAKIEKDLNKLKKEENKPG